MGVMAEVVAGEWSSDDGGSDGITEGLNAHTVHKKK